MATETSIKISVRAIDIPENWITAEEAHETATSIKNEKFLNYVNAVMERIRIAAANGTTSTSYYNPTVANEIYDRAVDFLRKLGYTVDTNSPKTTIYPSW